MPSETSLKFAQVIYVTVKIIQLICQIATVCFVESLKMIVVGEKQLHRENISAIINYITLASGFLGIFFTIAMNLRPQTMFKAYYTEYFFASVNVLCFMFIMILSGSSLHEINEQNIEFLNIRGYNRSVVLLLTASLVCEFFGLVIVERQKYLLRRNLNMQVNTQVLGNEVSTANVVPPSFNEILTVNVDSPPSCFWVICECIGFGFLHFATITTGLINRIRNFNFSFFRSNRFNTTQENLCIVDASQIYQSFEAESSLEIPSPEVDFASASLEFIQTTSTDQDQARGISLREEPSEPISGKNEASKDISKENTSEETSLSQEKTSEKKSVGKGDRKTAKGQDDERTETNLTKPEEDKQDNSSLETESSSDQ